MHMPFATVQLHCALLTPTSVKGNFIINIFFSKHKVSCSLSEMKAQLFTVRTIGAIVYCQTIEPIIVHYQNYRSNCSLQGQLFTIRIIVTHVHYYKYRANCSLYELHGQLFTIKTIHCLQKHSPRTLTFQLMSTLTMLREVMMYLSILVYIVYIAHFYSIIMCM